jgi:hypothetical protein
MLALMGGRSTRIIRSIGRGEAGHLYGFSEEDPSTDPAGAGPRGRIEVPLQLFGGLQRVEFAADAVEPA